MRLKKYIFTISLIPVFFLVLTLAYSAHQKAYDTTKPDENEEPIMTSQTNIEPNATPEPITDLTSTPTEPEINDPTPEPEIHEPDVYESDNPGTDVTPAAQLTTSSNPDRITYYEGFFEEPLSEDIIARINGVSYHENDTVSFDDLRYLNVLYVNFDGITQTGEIICNKAIAKDFIEIFKALYDASYQIEKIQLVDEYNGDDDLSCADNNTSCFNYRVVAGSNNLSKHALGLAIDINPFYNPYITYPDGKERISPEGSEIYADRSLDDQRLIKKNDFCYNLFIEHGFTWGGEWKSLKDYQHFQKVIE